jgi:hypothetical protein
MRTYVKRIMRDLILISPGFILSYVLLFYFSPVWFDLYLFQYISSPDYLDSTYYNFFIINIPTL